MCECRHDRECHFNFVCVCSGAIQASFDTGNNQSNTNCQTTISPLLYHLFNTCNTLTLITPLSFLIVLFYASLLQGRRMHSLPLPQPLPPSLWLWPCLQNASKDLTLPIDHPDYTPDTKIWFRGSMVFSHYRLETLLLSDAAGWLVRLPSQTPVLSFVFCYWVASMAILVGKWVKFLCSFFFSVSVKVLPVTPLLSGVFVHRIFCAYFVRFEGVGEMRRFLWCTQENI